MDNESRSINSIDRAIDIILVLKQEKKEMGVTEIANSLGLYKCTVYRTPALLENRGFVQRNEDNGKYWLGLKLYSLGMFIWQKLTLKNLVRPYAKRLAARFKEVVCLSVLELDDDTYPKAMIVDECRPHTRDIQSWVRPAIFVVLMLEKMAKSSCFRK